MILGTLLDELERRNLRYGLATLCVGGGWDCDDHREVVARVSKSAATLALPAGGGGE